MHATQPADLAKRLTGRHPGVVFVADDLGAWLVGLLADAGRKKLTTLVLGTDQERALRSAATSAVQRTAEQLRPGDEAQAEQLAMVVSQIFTEPVSGEPLANYATVLEALRTGIAAQLAVLDDATLTGTGQSSADVMGVPGTVVAQELTGHLVREITRRGSGGGPLAPLANQLNHDLSHLQGGRIEGRLAQLADQIMEHDPTGSTPAIPGKVVRLPPRLTSLAGREDLLVDLDTRLANGDRSGPRIVALYGLGGAGKTSAAVEYAHRHLDEVGIVWQFAAEDATVLTAGFTDLAVQLGTGGAERHGDPVAAVHSALATYPGKWLLIFDNATGQGSVQAFLPPTGNGQVLVTSQSAVWSPGQAVEVPVLTTSVAAVFLMNRTGDTDRWAATALAKELGGLPLALEQAAAYIHTTGTTLARFVSLFQSRREDLLARGEAPGHPADVAATLGLALSRLGNEAPAAVGLLRLMAWMAAEPVPLALLLSDAQLVGQLDPGVAAIVGPLLGDPVAAWDAISALRRYSLVTPAGDGLVLVHRLVQAVTTSQMAADLVGGWRQAAATLVEAAIPEDTRVPDTWPACALLLPHAEAALAKASHGVARLAEYLSATDNSQVSAELWREITDAREQTLGPEHPDTLIARHNLAFVDSWDFSASYDQLTALLPIYERVFGAEHPETLGLQHDIAYFTLRMGDPAAARDLFTALLPIRQRVLGPDHPDSLNTQSALARSIGNAGDPPAARDLFGALVPIRQQVLGPEHPDTLAARRDLADWTGLAGDPAAARDLYTALLPAMERVFGPVHTATLATRRDLADWTGLAGDPAAARDLYAALVPICGRKFGWEHHHTHEARRARNHWGRMAEVQA
jgi:Tetratricopeptide repeat